LAPRSTAASKLPVLTLAERADRHALYQRAVNAPEENIDFIQKVYRQMRGRAPRTLKEDFCGTALMAVAWAQRSPLNRSIGVDFDGPTLAWGQHNNVAPAGPAVARRVTLVQGDVLEDSPHQADVVAALNFSYYLLTTRRQLVTYFMNARSSLKPGGLFVLDCIGGTEAVGDFQEERDCGEFSYIWAQRSFNPLDHSSACSISFAFPDGSRLDPAFAYTWRMWTMPEIRDCLEEAGFGQVRIFWEYTTDDEGAEYVEVSAEQNQEIWLTYLVASP
jgi:SAM-dependent methyltransferase